MYLLLGIHGHMTRNTANEDDGFTDDLAGGRCSGFFDPYFCEVTRGVEAAEEIDAEETFECFVGGFVCRSPYIETQS